MHKFHRKNAGFTLVEMTIVLVIVSLLIGGLALSITAQQDTANIRDTQRRLDQAQEALLGFAAANGRLPCPAAPPAAGGAESPIGTGACTNALNGFVPATTLGLSPTDAQGYLVDAWGNPIRYAVFSDTIGGQANPFTTPNGMKNVTLPTLSSASNLLYVCGGASVALTVNCSTETVLTNLAVAVVFSMGRNGGAAAAGEEAENTDGDIVFVSKTAADFDDLLSWISPNILYNRMITAGRLP